jgi:peptidyl-prolyl cis-trans isomerase C
VNGEAITLGHMIIARATLPAQYQQLPDEVLYDAILDQLIQQTVLKQELNGEVPDYVTISVENETRSLLAADMIERIMQGAASEEDLQAAYDVKYGDGDGGEEFLASHILVNTEEQALAIQQELGEGADFATLAKERSTGPSGPSGGDLGWFSKGRMVPEFEEAVLGLKKGEVSSPVQTQFGWHVIILNDRRNTEAPLFDEVKGELAEKLRQEAVETRIGVLTATAKIERPAVEGLEPSMLQNLDLVRK